MRTLTQMRNSPVTVGEPARPLETSKVFNRLAPSKAERVCSLRLISIQRSSGLMSWGGSRSNLSMSSSRPSGVEPAPWEDSSAGVLVGVAVGSCVRVAKGVKGAGEGGEGG